MERQRSMVRMRGLRRGVCPMGLFCSWLWFGGLHLESTGRRDWGWLMIPKPAEWLALRRLEFLKRVDRVLGQEVTPRWMFSILLICVCTCTGSGDGELKAACV